MEIRSFLAFELSEGMKNTIARVYGEVRHYGLDARWVKPENIHLTIVFIGNVQADDLGRLGAEVGNVCSVYGTFDIAITSRI